MESQLSLVREPWLTLGARMFYGGVTEEILQRWGLMSVLAWALVKVIGDRDVAMWIAITLAALTIGVGQLPALFGLVPDAPAVPVARTIGLNFVTNCFALEPSCRIFSGERPRKKPTRFAMRLRISPATC